MAQLSDINIRDCAVLPAPEFLCRDIPASAEVARFVAETREQIHPIIFGTDRRILCVIGPCSIHDTKAGMEYAKRLKVLADKVKDRIQVVMRVYFEKPRTTVGWKGLIMDPSLDQSYNIPEGLRQARRFLLDVLGVGLPTATELLDPITPQYIADLISWSAIGARTTESQTHRQMASGLSMPLGFKNGTSGDVDVAFNAIEAARQPQTFLGISQQGLASAISTNGNPNCHLVLRGGSEGPNYDKASVDAAAEAMRKRGLPPAIMIDCSHANSEKDHNRQVDVMLAVSEQLQDPQSPIIGVMVESNLEAGNQRFPQPLDQLKYGQSITDKCIDWDTTEKALLDMHKRLEKRFEQ
ncbi:MAG: 3-deoxy-7-phosphoheptulonate synthase [Opitutales bacterium]|nr:3-deoxy-7-phosphoheptulonate synthase [Opitutales bacterium]